MDTQKLLDIYFTMNKIRKFEEKALHLFESNKLRGSVHLCIGEEAIPATVCSCLNEDDYITSTHRGHGHCIAKGADVRYALAELMGRATGYCKGRGGSMHIADFSKGNLGANAIVGGGIPIAVGAALASKMQKKSNVAVSFFGDSASNEGIFHESLNLASVWKLPVIFVCENNLYGISVPTWQSTSVKDIAVRGVGYDIPYAVVDGNKPDEIEKVIRPAIERARAGEGPFLIECKTYRWMGHWTGDPTPYRTKEEVEEWKKKCPIAYTEKVLLEQGVAPEELEALAEKAQKLIDEAETFALNSEEPDPAHVLDDVFYNEGDSLL
ncbi:MAG: thiamine pyrophosphate-dependent dehydrogenase E1 component subunit alpha [Oscillospiraceae bacterium]|nr:thiamine pyrophosphate-dependent dehydrogenase E1 component subunit alpha [Oscillospiraceae bacterium]